MKRRSRLTRNDLGEIASVIGADKLKAEEAWIENAPPQYAHLFEALSLSSLDRVPLNDTQLIYLLNEMYPGDENAKKRRWLRRLWGIGMLYFLIRGYYYNRARGRLAPVLIRGIYDKALEQMRGSVLADCAALRNGSLSLMQWQERMVGWIKVSHIGGALLSAGGLSRITESQWDIVDKNIKEQVKFLDNFSAQIAGGLPLDGNVCRRMWLYLQSGRRTYHDVEADRMAQSGFTEYRNILTPAEHCEGCLVESGKGWVTVGTLVPIGSRDCLANCKCYYEYRNPLTGEIDERV